MTTAIFKSPLEEDVNHVIEGLFRALGLPPEGILIRKESKIQEFCVSIDTNSKNTEALCYLAAAHETLENLRNGLKPSTILPTPGVDKYPPTKLSFWERGKRFLTHLL